MGPLKHYSADFNFGDFESASSPEDESEEKEDNADPANEPPLPPSPAPARRITRGAARDLGVFVPDNQLPDKCWSSSTYRK